MKHENGQPQDLARGSDANLPCVWMTAGLVAYKLCDLQYNCEICAFDAALSGHSRPVDTASSAAQSARWEFSPDRQYHVSHGWVQIIDEARVRYGIDVFAVRLLERVTAVVLPAVRSSLQRGLPACWVMEPGNVVPLAAPVSGTVRRVNEEVQKDPTLVTRSPYKQGWLLELLQEDEGEYCPSGLLSAEEMQRQATLQLDHMRQLCHDTRVGPTLANGGELVENFRHLLGPQRYHDIVLELLS
jgi:glycine cleavage system H lipoate-binding protein